MKKEEIKDASSKTAKKAASRVKTAAKKADDKVLAAKIEVKKTAAKTTRKVKDAAAKAETVKKAVQKPVRKVKAAKLEIYIQSPLGGNITPEEIAAKLPESVDSVFVRVDQNKLWWIRGEETGSVDIW